MAGPVEGGGQKYTNDHEDTPSPLTKEHIEGHVSALKSLIKSHNQRNKGDPICLNFESEDTEVQDLGIAKGNEVMDEYLRKPFKEARRTPLTYRIIEFAGPEYKMPANIKLYDGTTDPKDHLSHFTNAANSGEWLMPVWCRMFQQSLDGSARGWFERLPHDNINEWADLREAFASKYSVRRACFKEPYEISKIVIKSNESLTVFKERWTVETGFIMGVPEVMKISSFMDAEAYARTELPKGEVGETYENSYFQVVLRRFSLIQISISLLVFITPKHPKVVFRCVVILWGCYKTHHKTSLVFNRRDNGSSRNTHPGESRRSEYRNSYRSERDAYHGNRTRDGSAPYPPPRGEYNYIVSPVLSLEFLTKRPKEILAIETQLHLPASCPMLNPLRLGNTDRYCDYHQEKGHYTNDYILLRKQLEMALESGKLNNLVKDKGKEMIESWMNIPISFPAISSKDIFEEPLIVEAEVEGYLVRRVYVGEGSSVEVMFKHCFENLDPRIKARFRETQTDLVGFAEEISKPLGKIELEVCLGNEGLCRRTSMKFVVVRAPSLYNIILERPRHLEKKQMIEESFEGEREVTVTEEVLVNPSFPDQRVTIGGRLSKTCREQLECLLKDNMGVFAWEPSDMTGVPPCPKDYCSLPNIDCKVDSVMGFRYNCFMDAYKGYHQIQMAEEDEENTTFYTYQGTYCYTKMPFGLKNAGATYQRLVDSTFQSQIGRNLEAYVDDMMVKSKDEKMLLVDIEKTFDYLRKINMKLNPKKCSFRVEEGKFLGKGRKCHVQYVSMTLNEAERNYALMEKLALSLIHMTRRLRRYFEAYPVKVITDQPIKNILNNTETSRKLVKYAVELGAYNITFIPRNAVKGRVLADFLLKAPKGENEELYFRTPEVPLEEDDIESWTVYTNGASSLKGSGEGLVLIGPSGIEYTYALRFTFPSTNNEAKGNYEANKDSMIKYRAKASEYATAFKSFLIKNIPRNINQKADVLSKLASVAFNHLTKEVLVEVLHERSTESQEVHTVIEEEGDNWMTPIIRCLEEGIWPKDKNKARCLRAKIGQYAMESGILFKKGYLIPMLRCVSQLQANYVIREIHIGSCGSLPPAMGGAKFVIMAIDYLTKWIEAKQLVRITGNETGRKGQQEFDGRYQNPPGREKARWVDELPKVLWAHRTSIKQSNRETPFSLTYGSEAIISAEIGIPTYRTLMVREEYNEEEMRLNLDLLRERRETAAIREAKYKTKMEQYYNRKVRRQVSGQ
uniref:Reverse transcriptase domain-containing protein n=1 Tax=Tanacetum cinerariifolium TaxID=118510 RepID=A0A6L2K4B4_TANCI|nr:hypothetical protein [Tanacetum cinerariifolium]